MTEREGQNAPGAPDARPMTGQRSLARGTWWAPLALLGLVAAAYGRTLSYDLVSHDHVVFRANPVLQGRVGWREIFAGPASVYFGLTPGTDRVYRPLLAVSAAADHWVWGSSTAGFHLTSVLLHLAVVLLLWQLAWRLTGRAGVSWFAAALLAVHPTAVEAVAFLSARMDVVVGLGMTAALLLLRGSLGPGGGWRLAAALGCFALALSAKETAMATPLLVTWAAWVLPRWFGGRAPEAPRVVLAARVAPFWLLLGLYAGLRYAVIGGFAPIPVRLVDLPARVPRALVALATYGEITLLPPPVNEVYSVFAPASLADPRLLFGLALVSCLFLGLVWLRRRQPVAALGLGWYAAALLPTSNLLAVNWMQDVYVAERTLYPALVGWCLFVALGAQAVWRAAPPPVRPSRWLRAGAGAAVVGTFLLITVVKVGAWRDDLTVWTASVTTNPHSFLTRLNLGWARLHAGDVAGAQGVVREVATIFPPDPHVAFLAGRIAEAQGDIAEALRQYRHAVSMDPSLPGPYWQAVNLAVRAGDWTQAADWFAAAAERFPERAWPQMGLGSAREREGRPDLARAHFDRAAGLDPASAERPWFLSRLLAAQGREDEAVRAAEEALALDPSFVPARRALALIAEREGRMAEAAAQWRRIARAIPPSQREEALAHLRRLEAAPAGRAPAGRRNDPRPAPAEDRP